MSIRSQAQDILSTATNLAGKSIDIGLCSHSGDVVPGDIFVAQGDGVLHIDEAFANGAVVAVCMNDKSSDEFRHLYGERLFLASKLDDVVGELLEAIYADVLKKVLLVGVTGTNGKTSTAYFASGLLSSLGARAGYIGTMGYGVYGEGLVKTRNTTPDGITTRRYISDLSKKGCNIVVSEVSSHGIALNRLSGIDFHAGVFTNISRDHLDFHETMDAYTSVKASFFYGSPDRIAVINSDDPAGKGIIGYLRELGGSNIYTYGLGEEQSPEKNSFRCVDFVGDQDGYFLTINSENKSSKARLRVYGKYQIENVMAAVTLCVAMGYPLEDVAEAVDQLVPVPGRMERIGLCVRSKPAVYVDYAHTPDGISAVAKSFSKDKCWCVFGCGGNRDRGKRPEMGRAAADHSSHVVICDDNARFESPEQIILDILSGIGDKRSVSVCRDRAQAVCYAIGKADVEDKIFLLGKGDEDVIDYGQFSLSSKDSNIARQCLGVL